MFQSRAEELRHQLQTKAWNAVQELIDNFESERFFLDYKNAVTKPGSKRLEDSDVRNLAKGISGFGNSEGGIILWGVDCDSKTAIPKLAVFENPQQFVVHLEGWVTKCTMPPHTGVESGAIVDPADSTRGVAYTYVPQASMGPLQRIQPKGKEFFYIRAGSDFHPAPYGVIAGLFGRAPHPHLTVYYQVKYQPGGKELLSVSIEIFLINDGPVIVRDAYLTMALRSLPSPTHNSVASMQAVDAGWDVTGQNLARTAVARDGYKIAPQSLGKPLRTGFILAPPFTERLEIGLTFGCHGAPPTSIQIGATPDECQEAFRLLTANSRAGVVMLLGLKDDTRLIP